MKSMIPSNLPPDFSRDVRCVLGLPFDAITEAQAEAVVRRAVLERKRCFMSTPNLNFAVACLEDKAFRLSVLQSDLSLADGWPVIAYARLSDTRLPERVAGSTLFDRLRASEVRPPLSVYFFGGPDGAAQAACKQLESTKGGVGSAGFEAPGFGTIEEMSTEAQIERINRARPDMLVLALGAKKGQAWIQHNLPRLDIPVVSHLGAVVNFVAGSVRRAPAWVQSAGLEWLWRVREEPTLWRRYVGDGTALLRLLAHRLMPWGAQRPLKAAKSADYAKAQLNVERGSGGSTIVLSGPWTQQNSARMREEFSQLSCRGEQVTIDMAAVTHLDSSSIALMTLLYGWQLKASLNWKIAAPSAAACLALRSAHAEYLLDAVPELA
jgi:N-acetylglucosaminyldiphosphoundecaprenol N-acetyl-beta-D-mannosaminyltransferase